MQGHRWGSGGFAGARGRGGAVKGGHTAKIGPFQSIQYRPRPRAAPGQKAPFPVNIVQPDSFLTLHYRLAGPGGGDVVTTFNDKPATLSLGAGQLAPAIEACLLGLPEGVRQTFHLEAGVAYGERNPQMLQRVARTLLAQHGDADGDYRVGDVVEFPTPDGAGRFAGVVRELGSDWVLFDFNHPLAGQPVTFEVQVIGVM
jgi:FKBP-type peptidyl-prolyl cis-trans isomerase SlpA